MIQVQQTINSSSSIWDRTILHLNVCQKGNDSVNGTQNNTIYRTSKKLFLLTACLKGSYSYAAVLQLSANLVLL